MTEQQPSYASLHPAPSLDAPLREHQDWIRKGRREGGVTCPACGQRCQDYARRIHDKMAVALEKMYRKGGTERWVKRTTLLRLTGQRGGDDAKLEYWGLIETPTSGDDMPDKKKSGWARVTKLGELFLMGGITVHEIAWIYNGEVIEFAGEQVSYRDRRTTPFDEEELRTTLHQ